MILIREAGLAAVEYLNYPSSLVVSSSSAMHQKEAPVFVFYTKTPSV